MILVHKENIEKNKKKEDPSPLETEMFWVKLAAISAVKNRKSDGRLMPAYDPKKLFPEYFASPQEREKIERKRQEKMDQENVRWMSPSDAQDDWEKTQALLAQHANVPLGKRDMQDRYTGGGSFDEPLEDPVPPPEKVERFDSPDQPLTDDDLNWL